MYSSSTSLGTYLAGSWPAWPPHRRARPSMRLRPAPPRLASALVGEGRATGYGVGDGEVRDHRERVGPAPITDMAVSVASPRVAVDPSPELGHDPVQVEALH